MRIFVDVAFALLLVVNVLLGWRYGLLRRTLAAAGLFGGLALATLLGNAVAESFYGTGKPNALYADAWAFMGVTAAVVVAVEILGAMYHDKMVEVASLMFDRVVACIVGAVLAFLEVAAGCVVALSVGGAADQAYAPLPADRSVVAASVRDSVVGGEVNRIQSNVLDLFRPVLPKDLPAHLADSARIGTAK